MSQTSHSKLNLQRMTEQRNEFRALPQLSAVAVGDIRGPFATDHLRAYPLNIIATPNTRNTMMTAGYTTSDASNRRKRGCWPCFDMR